MARYYHSIQQEDTSIYFARQAIESTINTPFSNMSMRPAKLLTELFENKNNESAYKYVRMYMSANDSLFNTKQFNKPNYLVLKTASSSRNWLQKKKKLQKKDGRISSMP